MAPTEPNAKPRPLQGRDRRAHPRAAASWPCEIALTTGPHAGVVQARLRDVSRAGVSFWVDRPVALMTMLDIVLDLPLASGPRRVRAKGAVVRCRRIGPNVEHYEIAVFLHEIAEGDRRAIDLHVRGAIAAGAAEPSDDD